MEIQRSKRSRKSSSIDEHSNGDIPDWLLFEILLRLPPHFVCSYKIISKQWLSVASDSNFIRAYISRAKLLPSPWTVVTFRFDQVSLYANSWDCIMPRHLYLKPHLCKLRLPCDKLALYVLGVSDGLVLYCSCSYSWIEGGPILFDFYISNPVTGQWISSRASGSSHAFREWGFLTRVDEFGVLKSYRVVLVDRFREVPAQFLAFSVYYSEVSEWKKFKVPILHASCRFLWGPAAELDGILHWVDTKLGVVAYDPDRNPEHVRTIKQPHDVTRCCPLGSCTPCRGKLRLFQNSSGDGSFRWFKIWQLDDYDAGEWSLRHKVTNADISRNVDHLGGRILLEPLVLDHSDEDAMCFKLTVVRENLDIEQLVSYNFKTKALVDWNEMVVRDGPFRLRYLITWRTYLFVVPPWPTIVADNRLDRRRRSG